MGKRICRSPAPADSSEKDGRSIDSSPARPPTGRRTTCWRTRRPSLLRCRPSSTREDNRPKKTRGLRRNRRRVTARDNAREPTRTPLREGELITGHLRGRGSPRTGQTFLRPFDSALIKSSLPRRTSRKYFRGIFSRRSGGINCEREIKFLEAREVEDACKIDRVHEGHQ